MDFRFYRWHAATVEFLSTTTAAAAATTELSAAAILTSINGNAGQYSLCTGHGP
jgi:hypothetical protein